MVFRSRRWTERGWRGFGGLRFWVNAGLLGSGVSGRGHCRVAVLQGSGLLRFANLFITISHCAWRRVISLSKATKKRSKENAFTALPEVSTACSFDSWVPQKHGARQSLGCVKPSFSEHGYPTLRHQCLNLPKGHPALSAENTPSNRFAYRII